MNTEVLPVVDSDSLRKYKKATNFFETPAGLADRMAELMDCVGLNAKILEPSAGRGALIRAVQRAIKYEVAPIDFCETQAEMAEGLERSGLQKVGEDFMQFCPGPAYDAVIMNPPYSNRQAEAHVNHAWDCIRPGGRIVALVGESAAEWMDEEFSGHIFVRDEIEKGTFPETNIKTVLFLIIKPLHP